MDLDPQIAETIVSNLKGVFGHEINLFDTTGTIIASTDRTRIGTSHDGARLVIRTKEPITIDKDHEYKGAKYGVNVPVMFNDSVVAVIGITGEREEVEPFGNVIKKMTEILIREQWEQVSRFDQRERMADLVRMLCLKRHDEEMCDYLASVMRIDLMRPRRCVVGKLIATPGTTSGAEGENAYSVLYSRFQQLRKSFFSVAGNQVRMFVDMGDERGLLTLLRGIQQTVDERLCQEIIFGIGEVAEQPGDYWRSYEEANKTADWLMFTQSASIGKFSELDYGVLLSSVTTDDARQLTSHVFGDLSDEEIDEYETIFDAYTRHNGSIVHCAEELFLHKNTLQNRLNKMARETGYNPRNLADYAVLSLAFKLRRYANFERLSQTS